MPESIPAKTHWPVHIKAWQESDISQSEYCQQQQLRPNQFSYWKLKLLGPSPKKPSSSNLVSVRLAPSSLSGLKVTLPNGIPLEDNSPAELAALAELLR